MLTSKRTHCLLFSQMFFFRVEFSFDKCRTLRIVIPFPFRHLSFFLNFNFHDQVLLTWHIFSFPRLFFLVSIRVLCLKIHGCFLGFNLILQVSGTWHVFSIPCLQTFVFLISIFFHKCSTLRKVLHFRSDTCSFFLF